MIIKMLRKANSDGLGLLDSYKSHAFNDGTREFPILNFS